MLVQSRIALCSCDMHVKEFIFLLVLFVLNSQQRHEIDRSHKMNKQPKKICNAASSLLKMSLRSGFISGRRCSGGTGAAKNSLRSGLEQRPALSPPRSYLTWQRPSAHCRPPQSRSAWMPRDLLPSRTYAGFMNHFSTDVKSSVEEEEAS